MQLNVCCAIQVSQPCLQEVERAFRSLVVNNYLYRVQAYSKKRKGEESRREDKPNPFGEPKPCADVGAYISSLNRASVILRFHNTNL